MKSVVVIAMGIALGLSVAASAQENRSEISLQGGGLFKIKRYDRKWHFVQHDRERRHFGDVSLPFEPLDLGRKAAYGFSVDTQKYSGLFRAHFAFSPASIDFTGRLRLESSRRGRHSRVNAVPAGMGGGAHAVRAHRRSVQLALGRAGRRRGARSLYGGGMNYAIHKGLALPCGVSGPCLRPS